MVHPALDDSFFADWWFGVNQTFHTQPANRNHHHQSLNRATKKSSIGSLPF